MSFFMSSSEVRTIKWQRQLNCILKKTFTSNLIDCVVVNPELRKSCIRMVAKNKYFFLGSILRTNKIFFRQFNKIVCKMLFRLIYLWISMIVYLDFQIEHFLANWYLYLTWVLISSLRFHHFGNKKSIQYNKIFILYHFIDPLRKKRKRSSFVCIASNFNQC